METSHSESGTPRVAVIGCGHWGRHLLRNFDALGALGAAFDADPSVRSRVAGEYPRCRVEQALEVVLARADIEAVAIATPAETHAAVARAALLAGKDVFVEKPLCLDVAQGAALVALARERERILMVGHLLWYHPAVLRLRELIHDGVLGRIQYIYSNRLNLGRFRREENILWSFAPHDISVILGLAGDEPTTVSAHGGSYLHPQISDVTVSTLAFASGVRAHLFVSWLHPYKEQKLVVVGERGMAVFDDLEAERKLRVFAHSIDWKNQTPVPRRAEAETIALDPIEPLRAECEHFLGCVLRRETPRTDGEEGLRVLSVLARCQRALSEESAPDAARATSGAGAAGAASSGRGRDYFAHESAFLHRDVEIGPGTKIWHVCHIREGSRIGAGCTLGQNVVVGPRVRIGDGVKIQNNVSVYEGVTLEDHVFCGPSVVFTNVHNPRSEISRMDEVRSTLVRRGATLGANSTVRCGATIGRYAFVGAGAVVLTDVPDYGLVVGNPARLRGWICECGVRLGFGDSRAHCGCGRSYVEERGRVAPAEPHAARAAGGRA